MIIPENMRNEDLYFNIKRFKRELKKMNDDTDIILVYKNGESEKIVGGGGVEYSTVPYRYFEEFMDRIFHRKRELQEERQNSLIKLNAPSSGFYFPFFGPKKTDEVQAVAEQPVADAEADAEAPVAESVSEVNVIVPETLNLSPPEPKHTTKLDEFYITKFREKVDYILLPTKLQMIVRQEEKYNELPNTKGNYNRYRKFVLY